MQFPTAFIQTKQGLIPVAVLGLKSNQNLFVSEDGSWVGGYVPATYRSFPFQIANAADGAKVLVVDEGSGLVTDTEGEEFFDEAGQPSQAMQSVISFLEQLQADREITQRICEAIADAELFQPLTLEVETDGITSKIEGLFRIDEIAFNALPLTEFDTLRRSGALPVIYCHFLSMQHLPMLGKLAQTSRTTQVATSSDLNLEFLNNGGTLNFGGSFN